MEEEEQRPGCAESLSCAPPDQRDHKGHEDALWDGDMG